jgi:hypothetical protein
MKEKLCPKCKRYHKGKNIHCDNCLLEEYRDNLQRSSQNNKKNDEKRSTT